MPAKRDSRELRSEVIGEVDAYSRSQRLAEDRDLGGRDAGNFHRPIGQRKGVDEEAILGGCATAAPKAPVVCG
jgi:hypothetical protein